MERINLDFEGFMQLDKDDIEIRIIGETEDFERVEPKNLTADEIIEGISNGKYYVSFEECYKNQLDGEIKMYPEKEDD